MGASIRLGRVLGIPVEINVSWFFIFILLTVVLSQQFSDANLHWPAAQRWAVAMLMAVLFFLSVLAHELSHSIVAVRRGIPVRGITLFIFGGVSRLAHEPGRPFTEFTVAVVGPLSSLILSGLFGGVWYLLGAGDSTLEVILFLLAWTNLTLGVFNILPGYPLDGGRVLRAAVWGITGSYRQATQIAARAGQTIGVFAVVSGVPLGLFVDAINGVWIALVGGFLFSAAAASYPKSGDSEVRPAAGGIGAA